MAWFADEVEEWVDSRAARKRSMKPSSDRPEFGLGPEHVHDPFNIFMTTGLNDDGKPFYLPSDAKKGDHVELFAHMDALIAVSACSGGSSGSRSLSLAIEIFALG